MTNTHSHDDFRHIIPDRAMGYFPGPGDTSTQFVTFDLVGSGGVYSNVIDLFPRLLPYIAITEDWPGTAQISD